MNDRERGVKTPETTSFLRVFTPRCRTPHSALELLAIDQPPDSAYCPAAFRPPEPRVRAGSGTPGRARMRVRSWLIRGLILAGVAALAALAWLANSWVSPERVREQVIAHPLRTVRRRGRSRRLGAHADPRRHRRHRPAAHAPRRPAGPPFLVVPNADPVPRQGTAQPRPARHPQGGTGEPDVPPRAVRGRQVERRRGAQARDPADKPVPTFVIKGGTITVIDRDARRAAAGHAHRRAVHAAQRPAADAHGAGAARPRRVTAR